MTQGLVCPEWGWGCGTFCVWGRECDLKQEALVWSSSRVDRIPSFGLFWAFSCLEPEEWGLGWAVCAGVVQLWVSFLHQSSALGVLGEWPEGLCGVRVSPSLGAEV